MGGGDCSRAHARSRIDRLRGVRCGTRHRIVVHFIRAPHPWGIEGSTLSSARTDLAAGRPFPTMDVPWGYAYFLAAFYRLFGDHPAIPLTAQALPQRAGAAARLRAGDALGRSAHSDLRRIAHRIAVVQHGLRVDAVVRRGVHGSSFSQPFSRSSARWPAVHCAPTRCRACCSGWRRSSVQT